MYRTAVLPGSGGRGSPGSVYGSPEIISPIIRVTPADHAADRLRNPVPCAIVVVPNPLYGSRLGRSLVPNEPSEPVVRVLPPVYPDHVAHGVVLVVQDQNGQAAVPVRYPVDSAAHVLGDHGRDAVRSADPGESAAFHCSRRQDPDPLLHGRAMAESLDPQLPFSGCAGLCCYRLTRTAST